MFKVGDKVRVKPGMDYIHLKAGEYEVVQVPNRWIEDQSLMHVKNQMGEEQRHSHYFNRFEHVEPKAIVAAPKGVGDKIVCIEGYRPAGLIARGEYTIKALYPNVQLKPLVMLEELPGLKFRQSRFDMEIAPVVEHPITVGDTVCIVKACPECRFWVGPLNAYVGDGKAYEVLVAHNGVFTLVCGDRLWNFPLEALQRVEELPKGVVAPNVATPPVEPPKPPAEDIRSVLRAAKQQRGKMDHHITSFAYKSVGETIETAINPVCFATMRGAGAVEEFAVDTQCHVHQNKGTDKAYLNYLFNDSPWADSFLTKDAQEALDKGVLMNCERPISEVMGAATALREGIEQKNRLPLFNEMLEAGYHGNVAYLVAASCKRAGNVFVADAPVNSNHVALHTNLDKDALLSFFLNGWPDLDRNPMNKVGDHYDIWGDLTAGQAGRNGRYGDNKIDTSFSVWFLKTAKEMHIGKGWESKAQIKTKDLYAFASLLETLVVKEKK